MEKSPHFWGGGCLLVKVTSQKVFSRRLKLRGDQLPHLKTLVNEVLLYKLAGIFYGLMSLYPCERFQVVRAFVLAMIDQCHFLLSCLLRESFPQHDYNLTT
jgi:hypothetical protein